MRRQCVEYRKQPVVLRNVVMLLRGWSANGGLMVKIFNQITAFLKWIKSSPETRQPDVGNVRKCRSCHKKSAVFCQRRHLFAANKPLLLCSKAFVSARARLVCATNKPCLRRPVGVLGAKKCLEWMWIMMYLLESQWCCGYGARMAVFADR